MPAPSGVIPLCEPSLHADEWRFIRECLDTGWVSSAGPFVQRFETELATVVGARCAVATSSGTAALHVALLVAGVQPEDEVLVPALTFIAPANAVRYAGAWPAFIDVDAAYWQMDPERVADFFDKQCRWNRGALYDTRSGRRVTALVPVDLLGHPYDFDSVIELARRYDLKIIEDATESLGARYKSRAVGRLGDIACFSFNGNKIITTGGGGMIVTDNETWADHARYLTTQAADDPLEHVHHQIGYNYRLSNLQAALGCAQLARLDEHVTSKRRIAAAYRQALAAVPGVTPMREAEWAFSTFWMYTVLVDEAAYGASSRAVLRHLALYKIQARPLWAPLHRSPAHAGSPPSECPVADRLHAQAVSLPSSVGLTDADQQRVIDALVSAQ